MHKFPIKRDIHLYAFLGFLTLMGLIAQFYMIDWELEGRAQAARRIIYWHRVTSRYQQMISDLDFGAELYDLQCSLQLKD